MHRGLLEQENDDDYLTLRKCAYRVAIALNNTATSMMERGCYGQGCQTFKSAVYSLRTAINQSRADHQWSSDDCLQKLKIANQRASQPRVSDIHIPISVLAHDTRPIDVLEAAAVSREAPQDVVMPDSYTKYTFIHIEAEDLDLLDLDESGLAFAIMLYNFGIAHLIRANEIAATAVADNQAAQMTEQGIQLLDRCRSFLTRQYEPCLEHEYFTCNCHDPFRMQTVLFLFTNLLGTLSRALNAAGRQSEANEFMQWETHSAALASKFHTLSCQFLPHPMTAARAA